MASMASTSSVRLFNIPAGKFNNAEKKKMAMAIAVTMRGCYYDQRRSFVRVKASSPKRVGTVNGNKVNGIAVGETPLNRRSSEILEDGSDQEDDIHECLLGKFVEKRFVYRQSFIIRSYETGPDGTATMETLMNLLQVRMFMHHYYILLFCSI